jgi:competence ComEA-like helix-hairpin-helix protein
MKNTALICLLVVTLVFTAFAGGFFLGRSVNHRDVQHGQKPAATTSSREKLNINTATAAQLQSLPGIGQVLAQRIVAYRQENGPFATTEQLLLVEGIGETLLDAISEQITTGG